MVEMHSGLDGNTEPQPGTKHAGKNDPHNLILPDSAVIFQVFGGYRAEQSGREGISNKALTIGHSKRRRGAHRA